MRQVFQTYVLDTPVYEKKISRVQLFRFVATGGSSVVIEMFVLLLLVQQFFLHYLISNIFAFSITNAYNYFLSRYWVFGIGKHHVTKEASMFLIVVLVGLGINQMVLYLMVDKLDSTLVVGKVLAIGVTLIWNFTSKKYLVFKK